MGLAGRSAVITGASRGIGRAIALRFAEAGCGVALWGRHRQSLDDVVAEIRRAGGTAEAFAVDVGEPAQILEAAAATRRVFPAIDLVVNNAGYVARASAGVTTDEVWRRTLAVNLDGPFQIIRAFWHDLVTRQGRIINIASIAGRQGTSMLAAYCAAKHGLVGLTRSLAEELRGANVSVNAICPGSVDTEMLREGIPGARPDMTPDDIARTALFLAADAPRALTGACVDVWG